LFVIHRVTRKCEISGDTRLLTRGDALEKDDPPVTATEFLGKVTLVERGTRKWIPAERVTGFARFVQWGIRRSEMFSRFLLCCHAARCRISQRQIRLTPVFSKEII
ncbi:MAG TPA: hypothetical protein VNB49_05935, partial [Candidatus Dormibacteraeota bacterium]|nr:hypothetical protein [Candidatus Dormibacteraeota bacterium]